MVNDDIIIYMYYENRTRSRPTQRSEKKKKCRVFYLYFAGGHMDNYCRSLSQGQSKM